MTDKGLIIKLKEGDISAFGLIYERYIGKVFQFSRLYLVNREDVEEVVHDVFLQLYQSRFSLRENDNLSGLLFIITRNLIFNQSRRNINQVALTETLLEALNDNSDIEKEIEAQDLKEYIDLLIDEMPSQRKRVFLLSREKLMSYKEIAGELNISEKTVERHINEAIKFLRRNIRLLMLFLQ